MKEWTITEIEAMTEDQASEMAIEKTDVKGFTVYFVDFGGYFGYSCLVFKNNHHIHYVNDYELHHRYQNPDHEKLKSMYIKKLNHKLFTEEEIIEPYKNYDEYCAKSHFLHNYYHMQHDYESMFRFDDKKIDKRKFKYLNPIGFCYMKDKDFVDHHCKLYEQFVANKQNIADNYDYWKEAFLHELWNHEYIYNWQGNYDVMSAFGNVTYNYDDDIELYFDELGFNQVQRSAFHAAKSEYLQKCE